MANKIMFDAMQSFYEQGMTAFENSNMVLAKDLLLKAATICSELSCANQVPHMKQEFEQKARNILNFVRTKVASTSKASVTISSQPMKQNSVKPSQESKANDLSANEISAFQPNKLDDKISFDDIVGLDDVKQSIRDIIIEPIANCETYKKYGLTAGGAVLMYGAPGTGKTMIAKAIASEIKANFFLVNSSEIIDKYLGETEKKIEELFASVRKNKPAVIFFDEFDSIASIRGDDNKVSQCAVPRLLTEINGVGSNLDGILILAATNMPWAIDPAILSRFEQFYLPLPDAKAREGIFKKCLEKDLVKSKDIDYKTFADNSEDFSGRDIYKSCRKVRQHLAREHSLSGTLQTCTNKIMLEILDVMKKNIDGSGTVSRFESFFSSQD